MYYSMAFVRWSNLSSSLCSQEDLETNGPASDPIAAEKGTSSEVRNQTI